MDAHRRTYIATYEVDVSVPGKSLSPSLPEIKSGALNYTDCFIIVLERLLYYSAIEIVLLQCYSAIVTVLYSAVETVLLQCYSNCSITML